MSQSNQTGDVASANVTATIAVPVGTVVSYVGKTAPDGWLMCDGSSIARSTYPNLYDLIGGNVPDLRSRFLVCAGQGAGLSDRPLYQTGGEENHKLVASEMPKHTHSLGVGGGNRGDSPGSGNSEGWASNNTVFTEVSSTAGGDGAHNNMPPFYAINFIIKY